MMKFSCFHLQFFIAQLASVASVAAVNSRSLRSKRVDVKTVCVAASEAMDSKASRVDGGTRVEEEGKLQPVPPPVGCREELLSYRAEGESPLRAPKAEKCLSEVSLRRREIKSLVESTKSATK